MLALMTEYLTSRPSSFGVKKGPGPGLRRAPSRRINRRALEYDSRKRCAKAAVVNAPLRTRRKLASLLSWRASASSFKAGRPPGAILEHARGRGRAQTQWPSSWGVPVRRERSTQL